MKILLKYGILTFLMLAVLLACGCSGSDSGSAGLLRTVPSSAAGVGVIDLKSMQKKDRDYFKTLSKASAAGEAGKAVVLCLDPDGGVDASSGVIFIDGYSTIFTALADDPDIFRKTASSLYGVSFADKDGFSVAGGKIAMKGTQFWISLSGGSLNLDNIKGYLALSESKSYLSAPGGEMLAAGGHDILFNADPDNLLNLYADGDFRRQATTRLLLSTLFDNLSRVSVSADFGKDRVNAVVSLLDAKGRPARYNLDAGKLDTEVAAGIGGTADMLMAVNISSKLTGQIVKAASSLGGGLPEAYASALGVIDGTCAIATGSGGESQMAGVLSVSGDSTGPLTRFFAGGVRMRRDGDQLYFNSGEPVEGKIDVAGAADLLKGATAGFVAGPQAAASWLPAGMAPKFGKVVFGLYPDGSGVELRLEFMK